VIPVLESSAGVTFRVRVVPRAGRTSMAGERGDALLVRLAAPPVEGAANEALVAFLAGLLDVPRRQVTIAAGERSRDKIVRIAGVDPARIRSVFERS
jgi:uncharacterized protein (TIGR00251 family)